KMDFNLPEDIEMLRKNVRQFVKEEVEPVAMEIEENNEIPEHIVQQSKDMGLFSLGIPEEYGGLGLDMVGKCAIYEELGKTHNGYTTLLGAHTGIGSVGIVDLGTEEHKQKYLRKLAYGESIDSFALTEPSAGSNAANVKTTAEKKGDKYIINGSKHYITNAVDGHVFTVMAVTDPSKGAKGITSFIVEKDFPGFIVGNVEDKMGLRGSHSAELFFEDMEVTEENVLGEVNRGYVNALKILANGRAGLAARNLGSCKRLLEHCLDYVQEREQFGKKLIDIQAVQHMLAEISKEI